MEEKQMRDIDIEIKNELATPPPADAGISPHTGEAHGGVASVRGVTASEVEHSGRKPFVMHDFDTPRDKEMAVFTAAKKLSEYIFVITEKSPKKFRWSIITRLQNASVDVIENLHRANFEKGEARIEYQKSALVSLNLVDFFSETARAKNAISLHQTAVIAKQLVECKKLLNGWVRSTKQSK